jgi:recombination protein RecT
MQPQIQRALPEHMSADRFTRVALTTLRQNPQLLDCTPESFLGALMLSAQLGLEPGPLGHAYFVPFRNKQGRSEVQFIIGYKGLIDLARRSGNIVSIEARAVHANDEFSYSYGLDPILDHRPADAEPGRLTHVYALARYVGGGYNFVVLSVAEIEARRTRSKAKDSGPWITDYEAMALKTAVRALAPMLPMSVEASHAIAADEAVVREVKEDMAKDMAVDFQTGEVVEAEATEETDGER